MTDQAPERVMKIYKPPFRYDRGYIFDADGHMVADDGATPDELVAAAQIRGWGRIGYMGTYEEASKIQDDIGKHFAKALTQYWSGPAIPVAQAARIAELDNENSELVNVINSAREISEGNMDKYEQLIAELEQQCDALRELNDAAMAMIAERDERIQKLEYDRNEANEFSEIQKKLAHESSTKLADFHAAQSSAWHWIGDGDDCPESMADDMVVVIRGEPLRTLLSKLEQAQRERASFDLIAHLTEQIEFSRITFGPGSRAEGVLDHITKEVDEVRENPTNLEEWIDLVMLSLDGAWRCAMQFHINDRVAAGSVCTMLEFKLEKNKARSWPDWRTAPEGKAIEHDRTPPATEGVE